MIFKAINLCLVGGGFYYTHNRRKILRIQKHTCTFRRIIGDDKKKFSEQIVSVLFPLSAPVAEQAFSNILAPDRGQLQSVAVVLF